MIIGQQLTLGIWRAMLNASHFLDLYLGELQGKGVPKDDKEAFKWWKLAAEKGGDEHG